jgi:hypothetical protein
LGWGLPESQVKIIVAIERVIIILGKLRGSEVKNYLFSEEKRGGLAVS